MTLRFETGSIGRQALEWVKQGPRSYFQGLRLTIRPDNYWMEEDYSLW